MPERRPAFIVFSAILPLPTSPKEQFAIRTRNAGLVDADISKGPPTVREVKSVYGKPSRNVINNAFANTEELVELNKGRKPHVSSKGKRKGKEKKLLREIKPATAIQLISPPLSLKGSLEKLLDRTIEIFSMHYQNSHFAPTRSRDPKQATAAHCLFNPEYHQLKVLPRNVMGKTLELGP